MSAYWNKQIGNLSFILFPRFTIRSRAFLDISIRSMQDHGREEYGVEPRKWAVESSDKAPCYCLDALLANRNPGNGKALTKYRSQV